MVYRVIYGFFCFLGAVCSLEVVWSFSDICNGLMAVPNLICVIVMAEEVSGEIKKNNFNKNYHFPEKP